MELFRRAYVQLAMSKMRGSVAWSLLGSFVVGTVGCGGASSHHVTQVQGVTSPVTASPPSCAPRRAHLAPQGPGSVVTVMPAAAPAPLSSPITLSALTSSTVAVVSRSDKKEGVAYVADADDATLHTVDLATMREIATTELGDAPEQVLVLADGRVVVSLRHGNAIEVLEPAERLEQPLEERCRVETPVEPIGLAVTPDGRTVVVTSGWGHALTAFDATTFARRFSVHLPREPRTVVVSDDGTRAFVSHVVGAEMSIVDLKDMAVDADERGLPRPDFATSEKERVRSVHVGKLDAASVTAAIQSGTLPTVPRSAGCQGFALAKTPDAEIATNALPRAKSVGKEVRGRIFAPMISVEPSNLNGQSGGYGQPNMPTEIASVAVVDAAAERLLASVSVPVGERRADERPCLLPRAAVYGDGSLFVACLGIDALVELDARAIDPAQSELRRWTLGAGPTGVALDPGSKHAVVWSQFDHEVAIVDLASDVSAPLARIGTARRANAGPDAEVALGRKIFHQTTDRRISQDGRACASCHPDGREDALTWSTPDGSRQTLMLAGRLAGTEPYGWLGKAERIEDHLKATFQRLGGQGLPDEETHALVAYLRALPTPPTRPAKDAAEASLVASGEAIFGSARAACGTCHDPGLLFTDGKKHAVEARVSRPTKDEGFDTPSLRFIAGTAPYFHDGRYSTLDDLLASPMHAMGATTHLSRSERHALVAYLESL